MVARLAGDLVGYRRHHDVAFTGIGPSPDQRGVAFADAGVAHGVAFHAVGEEVPVLEVEASLGKGILDRLHRGGRSGSDRELRQVHADARRSRPSIPGLYRPTRTACRCASGLVGGSAKDSDRASLARRPVNPSVDLERLQMGVHRPSRESHKLGELSNGGGVAVCSDRVVKGPEDSPS